MRQQAPAETIAAISTPPGRGGIGMVRLSGPGALPIAEAIASTRGPLEHARARFGGILDPQRPGEVIDQAVLTFFRAPHSYTGEDLVEIATHGSPVVLDAVLEAALGQGARLARPGEFTERAFLSGKLDLTAAEAVHDLIAAQTLEQARAAAQQMGGALSRRLTPLRDGLLHLVALLEAGLDFASGELDDVEAVPPETVEASLAALIAPLEALLASFRAGHLVRSGAALALVGLPNAGKSSLFNRLLQRSRAIVTPVAGTTRDTVEETLALGGIPIRLIDTAGLRLAGDPAADEAEAQGIQRSREALADADLVLLIHDASEPFTAAEQDLLDDLADRPNLLILNKIDLAGATGTKHFPEASRTSALTGEGLDALRAAILERLGAGGDPAGSGALNNRRHREALADCLAALTAAREANLAGLPHEFLALDLHTALRALDRITGQTTPDDILARIFSSFCIGK